MGRRRPSPSPTGDASTELRLERFGAGACRHLHQITATATGAPSRRTICCFLIQQLLHNGGAAPSCLPAVLVPGNIRLHCLLHHQHHSQHHHRHHHLHTYCPYMHTPHILHTDTQTHAPITTTSVACPTLGAQSSTGKKGKSTHPHATPSFPLTQPLDTGTWHSVREMLSCSLHT